jgi:hypothetical protein
MPHRLLLLGFAGLACSAAPVADFRISGPYTHDNLSIYLLHSSARQASQKYLTLKEAMDQQKVVVYETGQVNQLAIENRSSDDVYIQSGDIVKGGRQDRVLTTDLVLPGNSGRVPLASFCVEHGRWTRRGNEPAAQFNSSNQAVSFKALKVAIRDEKDQSRVWAEVGRAQEGLAAATGSAPMATASPSSMQLTLENRRVVDATKAYVSALTAIPDGKDDVVGYAYAINGALNSAEVYVSHDLFRRMWPKMLQSTAAEAVAGKTGGKISAAPGAAAVQSALLAAGRGRESSAEGRGRVTVVKRESEKVTLYESRDREKVLHQSYVVK